MVFKDRVKAEHDEITAARQLVQQPPGLRDRMEDAARTEHLKGMEHDDPAAQARQRNRRIRVDPLLDLQLWSQRRVFGHAVRPGSIAVRGFLATDSHHTQKSRSLT